MGRRRCRGLLYSLIAFAKRAVTVKIVLHGIHLFALVIEVVAHSLAKAWVLRQLMAPSYYAWPRMVKLI